VQIKFIFKKKLLIIQYSSIHLHEIQNLPQKPDDKQGLLLGDRKILDFGF
jgi:hypothetical protein